jgi:signal peptidase I
VNKLSYVVLVFFCLMIFILQGFSIVKIKGDSMAPTLNNEEIQLVNRFSYLYNPLQRFDIVIFKKNNDIYVKRIIGLPGEQIKYKNNELYVNGIKISEKNFSHSLTDEFNLKESFFGDTIPENSYFLLGDNRSSSLDSRVLGFISKEEIIGQLVMIDISN